MKLKAEYVLAYGSSTSSSSETCNSNPGLPRWDMGGVVAEWATGPRTPYAYGARTQLRMLSSLPSTLQNKSLKQ